MIADTSNWPEWETFQSPTEFDITEEADPTLRQDKYMVCHVLTPNKDENYECKRNFTMYRFVNLRNEDATWTLFWHSYRYEWWFFHALPIRDDPDTCLLTFVHGAHAFRKRDNCAGFLGQRIMNIKEAVEMSELELFPIHPSLNLLERWFQQKQKKQDGHWITSNTESNADKEQNTYDVNSNQQLHQEFMLSLVPYSYELPVNSKNLLGFSVRTYDDGKCIPLATIDDYIGKVGLHSNSKDRKDNKPTSAKILFLSGGDQPHEVNSSGIENSTSELSASSTRKRCRENVIFKSEDSSSTSEEEISRTVTAKVDEQSFSTMRMPHRSRSYLQLLKITSGKKRPAIIGSTGQEIPKNPRLQIPSALEAFKYAIEEKQNFNFPKTESLKIYPKKVGASCFRKRAIQMGAYASVKGNTTVKNVPAVIPINMKKKEDNSEDPPTPKENFENLLPPIPIRQQWHSEMRTKGSYSVFELQAAVIQVTSVPLNPKPFSNPSTINSWKIYYKANGIVLFTKEMKLNCLKIMSVMSRMVIPAKPSEVYQLIRNPQVRFIYDGSVKKVKVLEELPEKKRIIFTDHEHESGSMKKERMSFCILETECMEEKQNCVAFVSVEYEKCPLRFNKRGHYLPSGWIVQELENNTNVSLVYFLTQMAVDSNNDFLETVLYNTHSSFNERLIKFIKKTP